MWRGISLANKCLLLFGAAIVLIILAALAVPWLRMGDIVDEGQREGSRELMRAFREGGGAGGVERLPFGNAAVFRYDVGTDEGDPDHRRFAARAMRRFEKPTPPDDVFSAVWRGTSRLYRYAAPVRDEQGSLTAVEVLVRQSGGAASRLAVNTVYLLGAGLIALGLAVFVFYWITTRLILQPVRSLKETAELVREGNLTTRSEIRTGDEFEELSETFNQMLQSMVDSQDQLRAINASLDVKLNELAERNVALYEANKLKGEFLANVSHELRTPLHSIIGFTELLMEISDRELEAGDDSTRLAKRRRFLKNIHVSGRSLLGMINGLLDLAKAEAGRLEVHPEPVNIGDAVQAIVALIRPLAEESGTDVQTDVQSDVPLIDTDPKMLQQIVFNFLSNAVKFSAAAKNGTAPPRVTVRAERLVGRGSEGPEASDRVRISVLDTGPGIAAEDLDVIFEKFHQLERGHTRSHEGSGLGLAICKELAAMLQGEIQVESEIGRGSMFSLILPQRLLVEDDLDGIDDFLRTGISGAG